MTEESRDLLREEFEADYAKMYVEETGNQGATAEDIKSMREGDGYGSRGFLNGCWRGWQRSRAALTIKMPPAPEWPDPADHDDMDELERLEDRVASARAMRLQCLLAFEGKGVKIE
ncbi:hypothetical protein [Stutzerimonas stutzeri]|uniref:hypothetical protein n=1 Tax=Stutzerimonas stutzeri TaxID=316 RepID=UPI003B7D0D56